MTRLHAGHILGITAFLVLPVALLASKGLAVLFAVAATALFGLSRANGKAWPKTIIPAAKWAIALILLAATSALWSPIPGETLTTISALALTFAGGFILFIDARRLNAHERQFAETAILWGGFIGFALLGIELLGDAKLTLALRGLFGKDDGIMGQPSRLFNTGATVAALYLWPWASVLWRRRGRASFVLLGPAVAVFLLVKEDAALAALVAGVVVMTGVYMAPRLGPKFMMLGVVAGIIAAPLLPDMLMSAVETDDRPLFVSNSGYHRLIIWQTTVGHIKQKPVFGYGFDSSRALYNSTQKVRIEKYGKDGKVWWGAIFEPIPLHPHNGILQVWLELGSVGAALLLGFLVVIIRSAATVGDRTARAISFGAMTSALMIASISYGLWQSWWQASLWLFAALLGVVVSGNSEKEKKLSP